MTLRPLTLLVLLASLPLSLTACGDKGDGHTKDGADGGDGGDGADGSDGTDGTDGTDDGPILELGALHRISPASVFEVTGGNVEFQLDARATSPGGGELSLDATVAEMSFSALFSDGTEVPVEAEVGTDGLLVLHVPVPGGLAPERGARARFNLIFGGQPEGASNENAVGVYVDPTGTLSGFAGDNSGHLDRSDATDVTLCHVAVVDADEDGQVEVLSLGVDANFAVLRACVADGSGDPPEWVCEDTVLEARKDLLCGNTQHFRYATGPVGIGATLSTTSGENLRLHMTWDGSSVGGAVLEDDASTPIFGVVLGMNNTKKDPVVPLVATLEVSEASSFVGSGRWDGSYSDGTTPGTWSALGRVTPTMLGQGQAWAGLFTDRDLSGDTDEAETPWTWSIDPSAIREGGKLRVGVHQWSAAAGAFVQIRSVEVDPPGFTIEAATAVGEDLDGDGHPELIVEAWGEGSHAAWLLPATTDKSATWPVRRLSSPIEAFAYGVTLSSGGNVAIPHSSFSLDDADGGILVGTFFIPQGKGLSADAAPSGLLRLHQSWSVSAAMLSDITEVAPEDGGLTGITAVARTAPAAGGRGLCHYGRCFASPGFEGHSRVIVGGGDGSSTGTAAAGAVLNIGEDPSNGDIVVYRHSGAMSNPMFEASRDASTNVLASIGWGPGGPALALDGVALMDLSGAGGVAVLFNHDATNLSGWEFSPTAQTDSWATRARTAPTLAYDVHLHYDGNEGWGSLPAETVEGGCTQPVLLSPALSEEEGALLGWRDGSGQTWLGIVDVAALSTQDEGEVPWLQGPVAVGSPISDPDGELGLSTINPGMMGLPRTIIADTPFLSIEDLESRFEDWDTPMEVPFAGYDKAYAGVLLLTGTGDGFHEAIFVEDFDSLDDLSWVSLTEPGTPNALVQVPRIAASLLPDAPPIVVAVAANGDSSLLFFDANGLAARTAFERLPASPWAPITAGDINGDGLSDLIFGSGGGATLVMSDGAGGALRGEGLPTRSITNFDGLLAGGTTWMECAMDADGGGGHTAGRAVYGSSAP